MNVPSLLRVPLSSFATNIGQSRNPLCSICNQPVPLEAAKTQEQGLAVHEECYLLKLKLESSATSGS